MESLSRLRLLLVLLCLVFSIAGARPLLAPSISPTEDPAAWSRLMLEVFPTSEQSTPSQLAPDVSPTVEPAASPQLAPDASPAAEPAPSSQLDPDTSPAAQLAPGVSPTAGPGQLPWPFKSEDFSFDGIGELVVADSPSESAAMDRAAAIVAEIDGPSANDAVGEAAILVAELDEPLSPTESVANELSPSAAVAMNEAASMVAEFDVPPVNEMIDGIDIGAALDSLDEKTSKS